MATVSAIIPTWNRADLLRSILENLRAQTHPLDQIIVVDNGSTDATPLVTREFGVDTVVFPENRGFAVAVNEGIRHAKGSWILIVNNDVVLEPAWLERLLASAERENAWFGAGKLLRPNNRNLIDGSWDLVSRAAYAWRCGFEKRDGTIWSTRRRITSAPMTAALFRRELFDRIGLLETRFQSYYEDVDFGVRCALAGLHGVYEPAAIGLHMSKTTLGKTSARVMFLTARNQVLILAKYYSAETLRRFAWPIFIGQLLSLGAAAKHGRLLTALHGKWAALRLWSSFRERSALRETNRIETVFADSEREIHLLQRQVGFNAYWRIYFSLVKAA